MGGRKDRAGRLIESGLIVVGAACLMYAATASVSAIVYQTAQIVSQDTASGFIGRLEIPRIGLSVVVAEGDDEKTLKVAVGHLPDTPFPWQKGNSALAGHRDSFFRPLRGIQVGDDIHLHTRHGRFRYRVTRHTVVDPDDLWVLDPQAAAFTLITCYPFDFIGPARRRFIVHAERVGDAATRT